MRPIIGITTRQPEIVTSGGPGLAHVINQTYTDAIGRSGGVPILLPPLDPAEAPRIIDRIDGLLLSGGGDVDPAFYGSARSDAMYAVDPRRDEFEFALVHEARSRKLPTLAICRGVQVVNVALGGTLIEDIPSHNGSGDHVVRGPEVVTCHQEVHLEADSRVARAIDATDACVNSIHHQAVRDLAGDLVAVGWAPDDIIEAIEPRDAGWPLLAVQWHPEYLAVSDDRASLALFAAFVDAAAATISTPSA